MEQIKCRRGKKEYTKIHLTLHKATLLKLHISFIPVSKVFRHSEQQAS